jgi:hypothetical protein
VTPVLSESLVVIKANPRCEIEVGVKAPHRKPMSGCQGFEQAYLNRRAGGIHEWHRDENHLKSRAPAWKWLARPFLSFAVGAYHYSTPEPWDQTILVRGAQDLSNSNGPRVDLEFITRVGLDVSTSVGKERLNQLLV